MKYLMTEEETKQGFIDLLRAFDDFCKAHDITYYLAYGTLLGALRHQGFIPWDNDVDIFIFRDQAEKLKRAFDEEPNDRYAVGFRSYYADTLKCRIYFNDKTTWGEHSLDHIGLHMDGFILDRVPSNPFRRFQGFFYDRAMIARSMDIKKTGNPVKKCAIALLRLLTAGSTLDQLGEKYLKLLRKPDTKSKYVYIMRTPYGIPRYPISIFDEVVPLEFEGQQFPCPVGYQQFLEMTYGDYMTPPPPEKRTKVITPVFCEREEHA